MNQPLQYLMIGCRQFSEVLMRNFCQHIWKRQSKFLSRSCLGEISVYGPADST